MSICMSCGTTHSCADFKKYMEEWRKDKARLAAVEAERDRLRDDYHTLSQGVVQEHNRATAAEAREKAKDERERRLLSRHGLLKGALIRIAGRQYHRDEELRIAKNALSYDDAAALTKMEAE